MSGVLIRRADVNGVIIDVRTDGYVITEVGRDLERNGERDVDAGGGALLPGLHDHHLHLLSVAAVLSSVDLTHVKSRAKLSVLLGEVSRNAAPGAWIRAVGYHERPGDPLLDRWALDAMVGDRPARIQHRGGALWILSSAAVTLLSPTLLASSGDDVERGPDGVPTGRVFRLDAHLRDLVPRVPIGLRALGERLRRLGITRVTDATPDLDGSTVDVLATAMARGELPPHLTLLGVGTEAAPPGIRVGPAKIMLADHRAIDFEALVARIAAYHAQGRAVALHCVTRASLAVTAAALAETGSLPGDRIEHASLASPEGDALLRDLGVAVVTQPDFLRTRGDDYVRELAAADLLDLYRYAGFARSGVAVCPSSDAPFGDLDPWQVMRSARDRLSTSGHAFSQAESVPVRESLAGYLRTTPSSPARRVAVGESADLILMAAPLTQILAEPSAGWIREVLTTPPMGDHRAKLSRRPPHGQSTA